MTSTSAPSLEQFPAAPIELASIRRLFQNAGCRELYVKEMAWNHDSKRQVYLTSDLSAFNMLPNRLEYDPPMSSWLTATQKPKTKGGKRIFGHLDYSWLTVGGQQEPARAAKIIYYPQYPEVRLSGFLQRVSSIPSRFLREKSGEKYENRMLFLGTRSSGETVGFLTVGQNDLRIEVRSQPGYDPDAGINRLDLLRDGTTSQARLLARLRAIHEMGWVSGRRLSGSELKPCSAPQAVGYTLEALLGVSANSDNEPDFEGFEIKAMTVPAFGKGDGKVVTVVTPEPDIGVYQEHGVVEFIRRWGYPDKKGRTDRRNFGGIYRAGQRHETTGLSLTLTGYEPDRMDVDGHLSLVADDGTIAAGWTFQKLVKCWSRKHAAAAYVPALKDKSVCRFRYASNVLLCEGTDLLLVLAAVADGLLYLDPALKAEKWSSGKPKVQRRNQFRIKSRDLPALYRRARMVSV